MPLRDWFAALIVITAWGLNFVVIKFAVLELPPLLLGGLRFSLVALPAVFFVKRPTVSLKSLILYGAFISLAQFSFLFSAIYVGMPAGLASLVLQSQAFFTVLIAAIVLREGIKPQNIMGIATAAIGLFLIQASASSGSVPILGFVFTLLAAFSWAIGNIVVKTAGKTDMLSLVIWGALIPPIPFFILSYFIEGPELIMHSLNNVTYKSILSIFYLSFVATIIGYVLWGKLLNKHVVSKVAPLSLMVPVLGLVSSAIILNEQLVFLQWVGGLVVLIGLVINTFGLKFFNK